MIQQGHQREVGLPPPHVPVGLRLENKDAKTKSQNSHELSKARPEELKPMRLGVGLVQINCEQSESGCL